MAAPKKARVRPGKPPPLAAFVSDPHVGNHARHGGPLVDGLNQRGRETLATYRRAVLLAKERGCWAFVVNGDLCQGPRPEPAILRGLQDVHAEADPMRILLVPGNHDMPDATAAAGNTAMAPLERGHDVRVVREPEWVTYPGVSVLAIPFHGAATMDAHVAATMEAMTQGEVDGRSKHGGPGTLSQQGAEPIRVASIHVGLWDGDDAPPWQRKARDGMEAEALLNIMKRARIAAAFVGNYHDHAHWGGSGALEGNPAAVQVGTLIPHSHGDGGLAGRGLVAFLEADGSVTTAEVPGPRFVTALEPGEVPTAGAEGFSYYVRARGRAAAAWAGKDLSMLGVYSAFEIEPDEAPSVEAVMDAKEGARAPRVDTDEGAIEGYVAGMVLPEGVDRARVLDLALDCWKRA